LHLHHGPAVHSCPPTRTSRREICLLREACHPRRDPSNIGQQNRCPEVVSQWL
jgi:hypothetical protein